MNTEIINNSNNETKNGMSQVTNIITEAEGVKVGDKVRHNKHEEVATVTAIREAFVNRADGYRYLYTLDFGQSVLGPFNVDLNGGEFLREAFTPLEPASEISGLTAKYQEQIVNNMQLGCGCIVTDGDENRKDSKWLKVRKAYTNDSRNPKDWTYCVCWYDVEPIDDDGYRETLRECENDVRLEQAARAMALFEMDCKATLETSSEITEITEQREQNDACISSAESRRDKANGQMTHCDDERLWLAMMEAGRVKYNADVLPLRDILERLGGEPEGDGKKFRCHELDLHDVIENIGCHIECPQVYQERDHYDLVEILTLSGTTLWRLKTMLTAYRALADKKDGYVWFEAA